MGAYQPHPCDAFPPASLLLLLPNRYDTLIQHLSRSQPDFMRAVGAQLSSLWQRAARAEQTRDHLARHRTDLDSAVEIALRNFEDQLPWHARRGTQPSLARLRADLRQIFSSAPPD